MERIQIKIAKINILLESDFKMEPVKQDEDYYITVFRNFVFKDRNKKIKPDIRLKLILTKNLPRIKNAIKVYEARHYVDNKVIWKVYKNDNKFVIKEHVRRYPFNRCEHIVFLNRNYTCAKAYLLSNTSDLTHARWKLGDIIYGFLKIILVNYLAKNNGIFIHSAGLEVDNKGLLFSGKSGAGKSTLTRFWHEYGKCKIISDNQVIVRKENNNFIAYNTPWSGEFIDYLADYTNSIKLKKIFFIYHSNINKTRILDNKEAFKTLLLNVYFCFWDKKVIKKIIPLCRSLITKISCSNLEFRKDKKIISFIRKNH